MSLGVAFALTTCQVDQLTSLALRYEQLRASDDDGPIGDADLEDTWQDFVELRAFYERLLATGRNYLFTLM